MATRATSFDYILQTKLTFKPEHFSQTAGCGLYYDSNNWLYAHLKLNDKEDKIILSILQAKLGQRIDYEFNQVDIPNGTAEIKLNYNYGTALVEYRLNDSEDWKQLAPKIDVQYLSDEGVNGEPGEIGGFTALFNFIGSVDAYQHNSHAEFSYYKVENR